MSYDRPQYGEYASREEQRARAGLPPLGTEPAAAEPAASAPGPAPSAAPTANRTAPARPVGRLVTFVLLGSGLVNVLSSIPQFVNMASTLNESMQMLGMEGELERDEMRRLDYSVGRRREQHDPPERRSA